MANPQPDQYTRLSNELLNAIYSAPFTARMFKIVFWVIRHSYGWGRKWAPAASARTIGREINMDHGNVVRTLQGLIRAGILRREGDRFYLVKDYEKWLVDAGGNSVDNGRCQINTGAKLAPEVVPNQHRPGAKSAPHIYKETKETLKKERNTTSPRNGTAGPDVTLLMTEFEMGQHKKLGEDPRLNRGAAGKGFKTLLRSFPRHEIQSRFNAWFDSDDDFIVKNSHRAEHFFMFFNRLKDGPILKRDDAHDRRKDPATAYAEEKKLREEKNARIRNIMDR